MGLTNPVLQEPLQPNQTEAALPPPQPSLGTFLLLAAWFGIVAGLVEGAGLLLFQRINWARWGLTLHVSQEIVWISPTVNLFLFSVPTLGLAVLARLKPRLTVLPAAVFLLTFLTVYDWLTLTERLYQAACLLFAFGAAVAVTRGFRKHRVQTLRFWKKTMPWLATVFVLAFIGIQASKWLREQSAEARLPPAAPGSPNVLVIVVDTLRADHLSSHGYSRHTSPEIDRLAREGVLFENAISPSSWSLPSHVSLVTGRYLSEHGIGDMQPMPWFRSSQITLGGYPTPGEALAQKGYRTGAFSANREYFVGNLGYDRGFTHFDDYFHSPADMFARTLYGREIIRNYGRRIDTSVGKRMLGYGRNFGVRKQANEVNAELFRWIDRRKQQPFFAFLNYLDVHQPYGGPSSYLKPDWGQGDVVGQYDNGVKYVDDQIGELMRGLHRRGLGNNTLVIITSDHGESLGQHGLKYHISALYWELIHVPLVIWFPNRIPAGIRITRPVTNTAIPATIMDLLGVEGAAFPGPPLRLLWEKPETAANWPNPVSQVAKTNVGDDNKAAAKIIPTAWDGSMSSLVTPQWQLIVHEKYGSQLYDWVHDPGESSNLINTPEGRAVATDLERQLKELESPRPLPQP